MNNLMTLKEVFDVLERLITEDVNDVARTSVEDLVEIILKGGVDAAHARVVLVFSRHPDKKGAWNRFVRTTERYYGTDWRSALGCTPNKQIGSDYPLVLACAGASCTELAWGSQCDQCLVRHLGQ